MIYTASEVSGKAKPTLAFSSRGITNQIQSRISDLNLFAKPHYPQVAYGGYKVGFEAFIAATHNGRKTLTTERACPLVNQGPWSVPLKLPRMIFQLEKQPPQTFISELSQKLEKFKLERLSIGKGTPVFSIDNPPSALVESFLPPLCNPVGPFLEEYSQLNSSKAMLIVYRCIDTFLRVHTYDCKEPAEDKTKKGRGIDKVQELRHAQNWFRDGYDADKQKAKKAKTEGWQVVDELEEIDMTPELDYSISLEQSVLVAKPSPLPSSTCFGGIRDVPNKCGLLFPYFKGLLVPDSKGIRSIVSELFFRNLGKEGQDPKEAYRRWRGEIGTFCSTDEGLILQHVLQGLKLAFDAQAICFLLFDEGQYKGFCLLGKFFSVFLNGKWHEPLSEIDLQAELQKIKSRQSFLEDLDQLLRKAKDSEGDMVTSGIIGKPQKEIVEALGKISFDETDEELIKEIQECVANCSFPTNFLTCKPSLVKEAIEHLTNPSSPGFSDEIPIYIPVKDWSLLSKSEYPIFGRFGPRGPSFRNAKGDEIRIPRSSTEIDPLGSGKDEKPLYIIEKPIREAIDDWRQLVKTGRIKMDYKERAIGNRAIRLLEKDKKLVWGSLVDAASKDLLKEGSTDRGKKRSADDAFGSGDFAVAIPDF